MEVHQLNAQLNWDSKHEANPWDLNFADVDVAMRCYPTNSLQVPFNFIQVDGQRGYSVGLEYSYDILSPKRHAPNSQFFNADPTENVRDPFFDSANNPRYTQRDLDDVEGDDLSDDIYNVNSSFYHKPEFDDGDYDDTRFEIIDLEEAQRINISREWRKLLSMLDIKYIQGIFKAHLQKPFHINKEDNVNAPTNENISHDSLFRDMKDIYRASDAPIDNFISSLFPQVIVVNHLSTLLGKNKLCANIGFNTRSQLMSSKLMLCRKFLTPHAPLFITTSLTNAHDRPEMISGVSAAMRGYCLQFRTHRERSAFSFSRRGLIWSPFSEDMKKGFLTRWRKYYENEEIMNLPPVPTFQSALPPEMRFHSLLYDRSSNIEVIHFIEIASDM